MASPKFRLCWILWIHVCMWLVYAPKMFKLHTNQLVFGQVLWIINPLIIHFSPLPEFQHDFRPPKCCELGNIPQFLILLLLSFSNFHLNLSRSVGVHHHWHISRAPTCFVLQIMRNNICDFLTSISKLFFTTKKPHYFEVQLCCFQAIAWAHIATSIIFQPQ